MLLTPPVYDRSMIKAVLRWVGWAWLIVTPIAIATVASWQTLEIGCEAEIQVAGGERSGRLAAPACTRFFSAPALPTGSTTSPTDLASMRISMIGTVAAIFLGVIALLAGYKAFFEKDEVPADHDDFACFCHRAPGSGDLIVRFWNAGGRTISLRDAEALALGGVPVATHPDIAVATRSTCAWTVSSSLVGASPSLIIRGALKRMGVASSFEAEFALNSLEAAPVRFVRTW